MSRFRLRREEGETLVEYCTRASRSARNIWKTYLFVSEVTGGIMEGSGLGGQPRVCLGKLASEKRKRCSSRIDK